MSRTAFPIAAVLALAALSVPARAEDPLKIGFVATLSSPTSAAGPDMLDSFKLGLAALGAAFDPRSRAVPARVVGWWPQCGRSMVIPVTASVLEVTTDAVLEAAKRAIAAAPRAVPAEQTTGAARRSRRVARQPDANPVIERMAS